MRRVFMSIGALSFILGVAAIGRAAEPASTPQASDFVVGEPIRHGNLTIFPVTARTPRDADRFITLDEGLKAGTVTIFEVGARDNAESESDSAVEDLFEKSPSTNEPAETEPAAEAEDPFGAAKPDAPTQTEAPLPDDDPFAEPSTTSEPAHTAAAEEGEDPFGGSAGNSVNRLIVANNSDKPLYLMAGEIIVGGDQDRAIGQDYVIAQSQEPVEIEVFCVEHGRWGAPDVQNLSLVISQTQSVENEARRESVSLASGDAVRIRRQEGVVDTQYQAELAQELAKQARSGKFIGSVGNVNKETRIAVQEGKGQSAVWEEVGKENDKSGVKADSGTFTGQYSEEEAVRRLDPYLEKMQLPIADAKQVVGVIVAVNGKVDSADILESTPLFKKLWPKLLKSYALDAANRAENAKAAKEVAEPSAKACTREDAIGFLTELQKANAEAPKTEGGVALTKHVSPRLSTSNTYDPELASQAAGGFGGGGFGGGIHSSGFSKYPR